METNQTGSVAPSSAFEVWWKNEGILMSPLPGMSGKDLEDHVRRICGIAWSNGTFKVREELYALRAEVNCRIEHGADSGGHLDYVQNKLDSILSPNIPF